MLEQIQANYTRRLTLTTLANTLGRQSAYLGRLFREEVGVTVHEYLTRARLRDGAAQVASGTKVEAVALSLGYRSKKNFYRQFKRRFGCTPEAYRRQQRHNTTCVPESIASAGRGSALKMTADRIRRRASRLSALIQRIVLRTFAGSQAAMLVIDDTGCYVCANSTAVSMTGYSPDELLGMPAKMLLSDGSGSDTRCRLQTLLPPSSSLQANAVLRTKSGGPVSVHLTCVESLLGERQHITLSLSEGARHTSW
jgi:PAS domain S-box-containing protein